MPTNTINANQAINAYSQTSNLSAAGKATDILGKAGNKTQDDGVFLDLVKNSVTQSIDTLKRGEQMSAAAVTGQADITDVVQAVTAAEIQVQTIMTFRDKMIAAYQEVMRMPI
ncbi:MAG: flagellar hook-basal body complex protein FliE [Alphaproteobacteria bacterium]|nr:flagellar hook-basal body complex protein FliE [Alphaproteobacteria bacterium]